MTTDDNSGSQPYITETFSSSSSQTFYVSKDGIALSDPKSEEGFWLDMYMTEVDRVAWLESEVKTLRQENTRLHLDLLIAHSELLGLYDEPHSVDASEQISHVQNQIEDIKQRVANLAERWGNDE